MSKNKILILVAILFSLSATAQKDITLTIKHTLGSSPFAFNQATTNNLTNNLAFTRVDYFMSNLIIIHDGGMETPVAQQHFFVRSTNNFLASLGSLNVTNVEGIKFNIGVDPRVNTSDPAQFTGGHPLAPKSPPMHWGWASGYRFAAVEGKGGENLGQSFELHSLFDANYFQQTVTVAGVNSGNDVVINLDADYIEALRDIDVSSTVINHGSNMNDLTVLENFRDHVFSAGSGLPLAVSNLENEIGLVIWPNPSTGDVQIKLENSGKTLVTDARVFDISGRMIRELSIANQNETSFSIDTKGIYFVQFNSFGINLGSKTVVIQ